MVELIRCLSGVHANDCEWPIFKGKYVEHSHFRKEWLAYKRTHHGHVRDELVSRALQEKSLSGNVRSMINNMEDIRKIWDTLDTCFDRPEKYIDEALDPIVKFRKYRAFDSGAVREFYSLPRSAMLGARKACILHRLINDQTLPGIMAWMPVVDWKQWARERPAWISGPVEDAFWTFVDQKWRDSLNVAAAEPARWDQGSEHQALTDAKEKDPIKLRNKVVSLAFLPILQGVLKSGGISSVPDAAELLEIAQGLPGKPGANKPIITRFYNRTCVPSASVPRGTSPPGASQENYANKPEGGRTRVR
jgi:hypothetical protein